MTILDQIEARERFDAARHRAYWRAVGRLPGVHRTRRLAALEHGSRALRLRARGPRSVREISLQEVVGTASAAKRLEFDTDFLPLNRRQRERWSRLYAYMMAGCGDVPPIEVYQLEDRYYVLDGHHRVSVGRALGRDRLAARVTELR